ncbi:phospholipase A2-like [Aplochiton taeniatus]
MVPKALWQFGNMMKCNQPGVSPLKYNNYGCWCGLGGRGEPRDDLDRCCKVHDLCYASSRKRPGCTAIADLPYVIIYDFSCSSKVLSCSASNNMCQAAVCDCDRVAANCFATATYNSENKNLDPDVDCVK